jgi:hypothetical protein
VLEPKITADDLEIAQFIYLLLHNDRIRKVIDTITSKVVLILGRFTPERQAVLDAVREELRMRDYLPVVFDFEKPDNRDLTDTVSTLAHMAKVVIADLTDAKSLLQELGRIVPFLPSVQPILLASEREYAMYKHFTNFPWVLPIVPYETTAELLPNFAERVIGPAERRLALHGREAASRRIMMSPELTAPNPPESVKQLVLDACEQPADPRHVRPRHGRVLRLVGGVRPAFTRATVQKYRTHLEARGLAPASINQRLSALRKLAKEATYGGLVDPIAAQGIGDVRGAKVRGRRVGNWLTKSQAEQLINRPDTTTLKAAAIALFWPS